MDKYLDGFVLSEAAAYAFEVQDVFPDITSFASAIPDHLKPLFLIPIRVSIASDGPGLSGNTDESDLWGTKTFVYDDIEPTVPSSEPGSIFDIDGADNMTHHQDLHMDENIQSPTDTTYYEDVDMTQYWSYPYRTVEKPVRHSSVIRVSLKPSEILAKIPNVITEKAKGCTVRLQSYSKKTGVFTFSVSCGGPTRTVHSSVSDSGDISMSCDCPSWQFSGPDYNAYSNDYSYGVPKSTVTPPDIRDPDRIRVLCKHAYSVLIRMDDYINDIKEDSDDLSDSVDDSWDLMEEYSEMDSDIAEIDDDYSYEDESEPEDEEPEDESEPEDEDEEPEDEEPEDESEPEDEEPEDEDEYNI